MSNYTTAQQDAKLARARALLAKAESTNFPAEAEALTAKAATLIAEYGLDAAKVYAADHSTDELVVVDIVLTGTYLKQQRLLLANTCPQLRVKSVTIKGVVTEKGTELIKLFGFRSDVERAQLLFTSLLLQVRNGIENTPVPAWENGRTFRTQFYLAFIATVSRRLTEIERVAQAEETAAHGTDTALVLVDRTKQVDRYVRDQIGRTQKLSGSRSRYSSAGREAGEAAGNRANIGQTGVGRQHAALGR